MSNQPTVRPFSVDVPEEDLVELRRRVQATRWPEKETVCDQTQGVQYYNQVDRAATSPPGSSRSSSPRRSAQRSGRFAR
jgi:Epoxide hydrolase N terminus